MCGEKNIVDTLKLKLRSVTKLKLIREKEILVMRTKERCMNDELANIKLEKDFLQEQLQDLKHELVQVRCQTSMIDVCGITEKNKIEAHMNNLKTHGKTFDDLFAKDKKEKEAKIEELMKEKELDNAQTNDQQAKEIAAVEAECAAIEQECAVLQKRNNAIMLKLRRKLLESENIRRKLMNQCEHIAAKEINIKHNTHRKLNN